MNIPSPFSIDIILADGEAIKGFAHKARKLQHFLKDYLSFD